jgi:hypothetical protein
MNQDIMNVDVDVDTQNDIMNVAQNDIMNVDVDDNQFENIFKLAIDFLEYCEANKNWQKQPPGTGTSFGTCGYTGPGIAIILGLFFMNGIKTKVQLDEYIEKMYPLSYRANNEKRLMFIINETIGNFFDLSKDCGLTGVKKGIMGIAINEELRKGPDAMQTDTPPLFYQIEITPDLKKSNLQDGINLISFTGRNNLCTFHHAVLYISNYYNVFYIIDSWSAINKNDGKFVCRTPTYRKFTIEEVIKCLYELNNTKDINTTVTNMNTYFLAHDTLPHALVSVNVTSPEYIVEIMGKAKDQLDKGRPTNFGGRHRKRKSKKNKSKKNKSKKNKSKRNKKRI